MAKVSRCNVDRWLICTFLHTTDITDVIETSRIDILVHRMFLDRINTHRDTHTRTRLCTHNTKHMCPLLPSHLSFVYHSPPVLHYTALQQTPTHPKLTLTLTLDLYTTLHKQRRNQGENHKKKNNETVVSGDFVYRVYMISLPSFFLSFLFFPYLCLCLSSV